jgi:hypothetical protein
MEIRDFFTGVAGIGVAVAVVIADPWLAAPLP